MYTFSLDGHRIRTFICGILLITIFNPVLRAQERPETESWDHRFGKAGIYGIV